MAEHSFQTVAFPKLVEAQIANAGPCASAIP